MTGPTTSLSEPDEDLAAGEAVAEGDTAAGSGRRWARGPVPVLLAVGIFLFAWQVVVWTGWRPEYLLPGPVAVLAELGQRAGEPQFWLALARTLGRALTGFGLAIAIGTAIGLATARSSLLRAAIGSLVTGLQTMPSVVWFPLAILLIGLDEQAILFVVVLGAAPSIANGVLSGVDQVPPAYYRLGQVLGAHGWKLYRHIVLPAALPAYVRDGVVLALNLYAERLDPWDAEALVRADGYAQDVARVLREHGHG